MLFNKIVGILALLIAALVLVGMIIGSGEDVTIGTIIMELFLICAGIILITKKKKVKVKNDKPSID